MKRGEISTKALMKRIDKSIAKCNAMTADLERMIREREELEKLIEARKKEAIA